MASYRESVERRLKVLAFAFGPAKGLTPSKDSQGLTTPSGMMLGGCKRREKRPEKRFVHVSFQLGSSETAALCPALKEIALKNTAYVMEESLIAKTFDQLIANKASLDDIERQVIVLAKSTYSSLLDTSPSDIEQIMITYIQSRGKKSGIGGASAAGGAGGIDARQVFMQAALSKENVDWMIQYAHDSDDDLNAMAQLREAISPENFDGTDGGKLRLAQWLASGDALGVPPPPPLDDGPKAKRYISEKYRMLPPRYDPTPLRSKWEALIAKSKTDKPEAIEAEKTALEMEMAELASQAVAYWRFLFTSFSRCQAEEMAYDQENTLIQTGKKREVEHYLADKHEFLRILRPALLRMIVLTGSVMCDTRSESPPTQTIQQCGGAINRFFSNYALRFAGESRDAPVDIFLGMLSLPRNRESETRFLATPAFGLTSDLIDFVEARLMKRSEQFRFLASWLLLVD